MIVLITVQMCPSKIELLITFPSWQFSQHFLVCGKLDSRKNAFELDLY